MDWTNPPATENQPALSGRVRQETSLQSASLTPHSELATPHSDSPASPKPPELRVGKSFSFTAANNLNSGQDVFTLTLGGETIELLPLKTWNQLDHYKWTPRGMLPGQPAGLEIALEHVKLSGEIVSVKDPAGTAKLQRLFNEWLQLERETQQLVRSKANWHPPVASAHPSAQSESSGPRFRVEVDKRGQVHIHCAQGRNTVATIGLTAAGFTSLCQQGLMRKPRKLDIGALHDWVELDGELCSFAKGQNDSGRLEQILNERYVPEGPVGAGLEVLIFQNAASPTGFDIQFPVVVAGVPHNQRHHLNDHSLGLLQDPHRCGLLRAEIIAKLIPPNLVFKRKTPDGGEQYLARSAENIVALQEEGGQMKTFDLSHPLNLLRLNAAELTAVFGHPTINRQAKAAPAPPPTVEAQLRPIQTGPTAQALLRPVPPSPPPPLRSQPPPQTQPTVAGIAAAQPLPPLSASVPKCVTIEPSPKRAEGTRPLPNLWLSDILARPALPQDWFSNLVYGKIAERFGNSSEGTFGPWACWFISLGESEDIAEPEFKGIFLTEKGSLGFLNQGQMARFHNGVAFLGPRESALEGIEVEVVGVGLDAQERVVFMLSDNYRTRFGVPDADLTDVLRRLAAAGAVVLGVRETLANRDPLEVVWTVPAEQSDPENPEALESTRPSA